ncbi:MAG: hypothetical protein ACR2KQ_06735 [Actinomycetota bacterium]
MNSYEMVGGFKVSNKAVERLPVKERNRLIEAHLDDVMVELLQMQEAADPMIETTFSKGEVRISVTVKARSEKKAAEKADALVRSAVHTAGGFTGGWDIEWPDQPYSRQERLVEA